MLAGLEIMAFPRIRWPALGVYQVFSLYQPVQRGTEGSCVFGFQ